jgi:hypothetical protein
LTFGGRTSDALESWVNTDPLLSLRWDLIHCSLESSDFGSLGEG